MFWVKPNSILLYRNVCFIPEGGNIINNNNNNHRLPAHCFYHNHQHK